jgi:hypothetical protein
MCMMVGWKADFIMVMIMIIRTSTNKDRLGVLGAKKNSSIPHGDTRLLKRKGCVLAFGKWNFIMCLKQCFNLS